MSSRGRRIRKPARSKFPSVGGMCSDRNPINNNIHTPCFLFCFFLPENDSEDEGPSKVKKDKKTTESEEVADGQEPEPGETGEEGTEEAEDDTEQEADGDSEGEGRQILGVSMSNRSESKPYSSVTHKCGVSFPFF